MEATKKRKAFLYGDTEASTELSRTPPTETGATAAAAAAGGPSLLPTPSHRPLPPPPSALPKKPMSAPAPKEAVRADGSGKVQPVDLNKLASKVKSPLLSFCSSLTSDSLFLSVASRR